MAFNCSIFLEDIDINCRKSDAGGIKKVVLGLQRDLTVDLDPSDETLVVHALLNNHVVFEHNKRDTTTVFNESKNTSNGLGIVTTDITIRYLQSSGQIQTGVLDYVVGDQIGYDIFTATRPGILDYIVLNRMGYSIGNTQGSTAVDYIGEFEGYQKDIVNVQTGIVDYLIDRIPYNILIEQERGWGFNWELISVLWETIDNNWENG